MKVTVIGAGITGIMSAYYLAKKGYDVTVLDREDGPAMACSFANGGQISVCNSETWNDWATVKKGIKWLFKKDAPLLIRPYPSFKKLKWIAGFLKHTVLGNGVRNTIKTIELGVESRKAYEKVIKEEGIKFDQKKSGMLHVFTQENDLQHAVSIKEMFLHYGKEWEILDRKGVLEVEPSLEFFKDIIGGVFVKSDWSGDIHKFCVEMRKVLETKYNVRFRFGIEVINLDSMPGIVVLSNGHEIHKLAKQCGDNLNVYPIKGYSITIDLKTALARAVAPTIPLLDNNKKIVTSRLGERLRIAGTAELTDEDLTVREERIKPLVDWVKENFPDIDASEYSSWACLRPMSSDMMPIIRRSKNKKNVYYHGGHGHLGWTLSAATGEQLANLIESEK